MPQARFLRTYVHSSVGSDMRLACIGFVHGRCSFQATDIPGAASLLIKVSLNCFRLFQFEEQRVTVCRNLRCCQTVENYATQPSQELAAHTGINTAQPAAVHDSHLVVVSFYWTHSWMTSSGGRGGAIVFNICLLCNTFAISFHEPRKW